MPILEDASEEEIFRLLQLFPASTLRLAWAKPKITKKAICDAAAKERDVEKITNFVQVNFGRCNMHAYVLESPEGDVTPLSAITDAEILQVVAGGPTLIIARASFVVILQETLKKETVNLLWPMRLEVVEDHLVLSLIVLERKPGAIFEENVSVISRSLEERSIVKNLASLGIVQSDLHKGTKALWEADYMDAFRVKFRSADSTLDETMDAELGIKANKPNRYEELKTATIFMTYFHLLDESVKTIKDFTMDPSRGYIRFPRYKEDAGDADEVVRALLAKNK
jgi:hypothetical protein